MVVKMYHQLDQHILFYKSDSSLTIQESSPNPDKYFGNRKKEFCHVILAPAVSQSQWVFSDLSFQWRRHGQ